MPPFASDLAGNAIIGEAGDPTVAPFINSGGQTWLVAFRNVNDTTRVYTRQIPAVSGLSARRASEFAGHSLPTPPAA